MARTTSNRGRGGSSSSSSDNPGQFKKGSERAREAGRKGGQRSGSSNQ